MKKIWNTVNGLNVNTDIKNKLYIGILMLLTGIIGAVVWLLLGRLMVPDLGGLICFIGYSATVFGFIGGILYLYNHDFPK